ncbi:hypothetical protein [Sphingomonas sp. 1185]|uniref:hypothetical protein n=1 Tax=Sphingomonas sp. 1185 TaxID=3156411 RepID=UPI003395E5FA
MTCPRCRHVRVLDAMPLWWHFQRRGWDDTLSSVRQRLHCAACLSRDGCVLRPHLAVGRDPPTGEQLPYPDTATWKRLVSRYRS